jgi:hypothetical protein
MIKKKLLGLVLAACTFGAAHSQAGYVDELEANDSLAEAQLLDPYFDLVFDEIIGDVNGVNTSTVLPHASVFGDGNGTFDYYSFTVSETSKVILDIDNGMSDLDAEIGLWRVDGTFLGENDDYAPYETVGAGGSIHSYDSFIQTYLDAGSYVVGVARYPSVGEFGGWSTDNSQVIATDQNYTLHVSVGPIPEPETYALMLAGLGLVGFATRRNKR